MGDVVIVREGEKIPVDGVVRGGHASVDQAPITGESVPQEKSSGAKVFAGTVVDLGALDVETEKDRVRKAISTLRKLTGQPVKGWHSPDHSESWVTPDLIADEGVTYFADWTNDELPFEFKVKSGSLIALPAPYEMADRTILHQHFNSLADYEDQILAAFRMLLAESSPDHSRIFAVSFTPWIMGQPYRIAGLERILKTVFSESGVVAMTAGDIAAAFRKSR